MHSVLSHSLYACPCPCPCLCHCCCTRCRRRAGAALLLLLGEQGLVISAICRCMAATTMTMRVQHHHCRCSVLCFCPCYCHCPRPRPSFPVTGDGDPLLLLLPDPCSTMPSLYPCLCLHPYCHLFHPSFYRHISSSLFVYICGGCCWSCVQGDEPLYTLGGRQGDSSLLHSHTNNHIYMYTAYQQ